MITCATLAASFRCSVIVRFPKMALWASRLLTDCVRPSCRRRAAASWSAWPAASSTRSRSTTASQCRQASAPSVSPIPAATVGPELQIAIQFGGAALPVLLASCIGCSPARCSPSSCSPAWSSVVCSPPYQLVWSPAAKPRCTQSGSSPRPPCRSCCACCEGWEQAAETQRTHSSGPYLVALSMRTLDDSAACFPCRQNVATTLHQAGR